MDKFVIHGGNPLEGTIKISGAKNAVLPLMLATILTDEDIHIHNVPYLSDVATLTELLENFGVEISTSRNEKTLDTRRFDTLSIKLNSKNIDNLYAPYSIAKKMRASFWALGPMLAKFGRAKVSLPGGCSIGTRQIDLHLETLESMGAKITIEEGYVIAEVKDKLKGTHFTFKKISVGATINAIMSAVISKGISTFVNCAQEPEIQDLCKLLLKMGAQIDGIGTSKLTINGQKSLHGASHNTMPDRIETGTYIAAVGLTGGRLLLEGVDIDSVEHMLDTFKLAGINIEKKQNSLIVSSGQKIRPVNIQTLPYPGFPTDMQAQFMALMCLSPGVCSITENLFENRFMHIPELQRMGANITILKNTANVVGIKKFRGADVMATDLRASVCLVLAALNSPEKTTIDRIYHIDRGYSRIENKLSQVGADIKRIKTT
ncbi:MAG TPA: UDP-N-acetylglucosamine 1-carboxyvinyltransferase [Candidatus Megaira endosymbiont of Nemacystus decipiens]|nr:UDP-N-acetylglucosamine 1-carboxyvinyltransferase [Candidatus Megaera endosymbiont of Nemacystus decipiens]